MVTEDKLTRFSVNRLDSREFPTLMICWLVLASIRLGKDH